MNKTLITALITSIGMLNLAYADQAWKGFYVGGNSGVSFSHLDLKSQHLGFTHPSETCNTCSHFSTFFPGLQVGYLDHLSNLFVSGIEANFTFNTNQNDSLNCNSNLNSNVYDGFTFRNQMQTSLKGRFGADLNWYSNNFLPYVLAGVSFANFGLTYRDEGGDYYSDANSQAGWLIGAGLEWAFRQHWSVRAEYFYVNYGNAINLKLPIVYGLMDFNGKARVNLNSNNILLALNYWF